jgi:hypothetical protein
MKLLNNSNTPFLAIIQNRESEKLKGENRMMYPNFPYACQQPGCSFAVMGIDKILFGIDNRFLICHNTPGCLVQKVDIITFGNYSILNFQGEFIDSEYPLFSIASLLIEAVNAGIFDHPLKGYLQYWCNILISNYWYPWCFIDALFTNGPFKWDELEIFLIFTVKLSRLGPAFNLEAQHPRAL